MSTAVKDERSGKDVLVLAGAPDLDIGNLQEDQHISRALSIDLTPDTIEEFKKCERNGKQIQMLFGKTPSLRIGDATRLLRVSNPSFRCEIYKRNAHEGHDLAFTGLVSHKMTILEARDATKGAESSLATLQASLAQHEKAKQDNSATFIGNESTASGNMKRGNKGNNKSKPSWKKSSLFQVQETLRSRPSSPLLSSANRFPAPSSTTQIQHSIAPTSAPPNSRPTQFQKSQAQRHSLLHFLAARPASQPQITKATGISKEELPPLLEKFAKNASQPDHWELTERWFKELDIWAFPYSSDTDRQDAVANAVRAFDRLRISKEDKFWQLLLPKEKRGKGIVLSKLNLGNSLAKTSQVNGSLAPSKANLALSPDHSTNPSTQSKSTDPLKSEMAPTKGQSAKKTNPATKPVKPSPSKGAVSKKGTKTKRPHVTDFGDEDEGSSDLEEVLSGINSETERKKSKTDNEATKTKKPAAGTKRKADTKFKSEEFIEDSSDLIEDDDDKPLAETIGSRVDTNKRPKTESGSSKPRLEQQTGNKKLQKKSAPQVDKSSKASSGAKGQSIPGNPKLNVGEKPANANAEHNDASKLKAARTNDDLKTNVGRPATSPSKPIRKDENIQRSKGTIQGPKAGSSASTTYPSKSAAKHQHSGSHSSGSSIGLAEQQGLNKKRPAENSSSPETPLKKRKSEVQPEKASTISSSSPLTNASDLPNLSSPDEASPRPNGTQYSRTGSKKKAPAVVQQRQVVQKPSPTRNDISKSNGVHKSTIDDFNGGSPNEMIESLKKDYSTMFREHITKHLALDQLPPNATAPDIAEYKAKFGELKSLNEAINVLLRRSGRGDETFSGIPKDFSSASVPGLMDHVKSKIEALSERYSVEREQYMNGAPSETEKQRLNGIYDEIKELEALRDH